MTLCIAEKKGGTITFAADSRITLGDKGHVDFGVKVLKIPVVVRSASTEAGDSVEIYNHTLGLCVVGSALNSYLVKETVAEVLQNLQFCGFKPDFSFETLCRYVRKIFERFSRDLCSCVGENNGKAALVLGGYCPATKTVRIFQFNLEKDFCRDIPMVATMTEILTVPGIEFYGSGSDKAKELFGGGNTNCFHILKAVIEDENVPGVGGSIQTGIFDSKDFKIKVIEDYLLADDGIFEMRHALRGINLYDKEFVDNAGLVLSYEFLSPFQKEMRAAARASVAHWPRFVRQSEN